jgi:hypothetical protein
MSSFANLVTKFWQITLSKAQPLWLLVTSCLIAVKKPCGLKNPVTQKTLKCEGDMIVCLFYCYGYYKAPRQSAAKVLSHQGAQPPRRSATKVLSRQSAQPTRRSAAKVLRHLAAKSHSRQGAQLPRRSATKALSIKVLSCQGDQPPRYNMNWIFGLYVHVVYWLIQVNGQGSNLYVENLKYLWSAMETPSSKLAIPLQEFSVPESQSSRLPGHFFPHFRDSGIIHTVQQGSQVGTHHYGTFNGQLYVRQVVSHWKINSNQLVFFSN